MEENKQKTEEIIGMLDELKRLGRISSYTCNCVDGKYNISMKGLTISQEQYEKWKTMEGVSITIPENDGAKITLWANAPPN